MSNEKPDPKIDVRSVSGLQDLLHDGVTELYGLETRDQPWVRLAFSGVNCGNALIRTQLKLNEQRQRASERAARDATNGIG